MRLIYLSVLFATLLGLFLPSSAFGRSFRVNQVPNNEFSCGLCHQNGVGGAPRNAFGKQVENNLTQTGDVDWSSLYNLDADGDQFTNGQELGDPNGQWEIGDPDPDRQPSHPADPEDTPNNLSKTNPDGEQNDSGGGGCGCAAKPSGPLPGGLVPVALFVAFGAARFKRWN